jgi:hypothetical protein
LLLIARKHKLSLREVKSESGTLPANPVCGRIRLSERNGAVADDPILDRLIASLDASFDASIARQEDEAASDLAFSMVQGRTFREAIRGRPLALCLDGGARLAVTAVGRDYVAAGGTLSPSSTAVLGPLAFSAAGAGRAVPAAPPVARDDTLLEMLRSWARAGRDLEVSTGSMTIRGRLACATEEHLELVAPTGRWLVGFEAVRWVRSAREGRGDEI